MINKSETNPNESAVEDVSKISAWDFKFKAVYIFGVFFSVVLFPIIIPHTSFGAFVGLLGEVLVFRGCYDLVKQNPRGALQLKWSIALIIIAWMIDVSMVMYPGGGNQWYMMLRGGFSGLLRCFIPITVLICYSVGNHFTPNKRYEFDWEFEHFFDYDDNNNDDKGSWV